MLHLTQSRGPSQCWNSRITDGEAYSSRPPGLTLQHTTSSIAIRVQQIFGQLVWISPDAKLKIEIEKRFLSVQLMALSQETSIVNCPLSSMSLAQADLRRRDAGMHATPRPQNIPVEASCKIIFMPACS